MRDTRRAKLRRLTFATSASLTINGLMLYVLLTPSREALPEERAAVELTLLPRLLVQRNPTIDAAPKAREPAITVSGRRALVAAAQPPVSNQGQLVDGPRQSAPLTTVVEARPRLNLGRTGPAGPQLKLGCPGFAEDVAADLRPDCGAFYPDFAARTGEVPEMYAVRSPVEVAGGEAGFGVFGTGTGVGVGYKFDKDNKSLIPGYGDTARPIFKREYPLNLPQPMGR